MNNVILKNYIITGFPQIKNKGKIQIGDFFRCQSGKYRNPIGNAFITRLIVKKNAELIIGKHAGISNSTIYCTEKIYIGNNVMIGGGCKIWDTDFHSIYPEDRINGNINSQNSPVIIGNNVFIGGFSIILKGTSIGDNAVIGAGSVVPKNIPANEIWAGNPAKFIRKLDI